MEKLLEIKMHSKLIIIGSGPAGYTAAIYAARANLKPTLIAGYSVGGQLTGTTTIDNWPGGKDGLTGPQLMEDMKEHAERFGTNIIYGQIVSVDLSKRPFKLVDDWDDEYTCDSLIIATGATAKYLGIPSEMDYTECGVSACATCDGFFYKDQDVAVIGGGNTAVEEAIYLSNIAKNVTLIHRGDKLRAEPILVDQLATKSNVTVLFKEEVAEFTGQNHLERLILKSGKTVDVRGAFVAIGHTPNIKFLNDQLELYNGHVKTHDVVKTNVPGVFVAGDVADELYKQAITSAATGCIAALEAQRFVEG